MFLAMSTRGAKRTQLHPELQGQQSSGEAFVGKVQLGQYNELSMY